MSVKIIGDGFEIKEFANLEQDFAKEIVYEGAGIIADAMRKEIEALPIQEDSDGSAPFAKDGFMLKGITSTQKNDLLEGLGVASIENDGTVTETNVGFEGYGSIPTKKYPKGLPNRLMARSIESGTSFRTKNPFMRRTIQKKQKEAVQKMQEKLDEITRR